MTAKVPKARSPRGRGRNSSNQSSAQGSSATDGAKQAGGNAAQAKQGQGRQSRGKAKRSRNKKTRQRPVGDPIQVQGVLEMHPKGYGFLRQLESDLRPSDEDAYVSEAIIQKLGLRPGVKIQAMAQPNSDQQGPRLVEVQDIDGKTPEQYTEVQDFSEQTPINPDEWMKLETGPQPLTTRVMDLLTPLGKGQRGLIVAPPRSGKTVLMQHVGQAIAANNPDVKLMVLLVDERPEEVTDMRRSIPGEVLASSLDQDVTNHVRLSQLVVERCKRLAEMGHDVFLLVDSLTRMARAFNKWVGNTGRTMSGGVDIRAMDIPKKLFASARSFENGGSLTILATALIDTGSRMDDLIFQEFKGTGNMELVLDRNLADRRIWPAIDIEKSGTRREEILLDAETLHSITLLRRMLGTMQHVEAMERLTTQLGKFGSNAEFLQRLKHAAA